MHKTYNSRAQLGNSSTLRTSVAGLDRHNPLKLGYDGSYLSIWLPAAGCRADAEYRSCNQDVLFRHENPICPRNWTTMH